MNELELWVSGGVPQARPQKEDGTAYSDRHLLHSLNMVKLETGPQGSRIHWVMFGANWSSLMFVKDFVITCTAPVTLRYFNAGWFEETVDDVVDARERIKALIVKSDVRFNERTYVQAFDIASHPMPSKLRSALDSNTVPEEQSVICAVDTEREISTVEYVGSKSAVSQIWGVSPVSFPCQTGHSYDRAVSRPYYHALSTGLPHYDHVLAAMVRPDGEVRWIGYQRLIFPDLKTVNGLARVKVVSELGPVDIQLL